MEGKQLKRKAAGYARANQLRRLMRTLKRLRTVVGIVIREIQRKLKVLNLGSSAALERMTTLLERAQRLVDQKPKDKNKLYALHAPGVECIERGKARQPYKFGVKAGFAVTNKKGWIVGA